MRPYLKWDHTSLHPSLAQKVCSIDMVCINHNLYPRADTFSKYLNAFTFWKTFTCRLQTK